MVSRRKTRGPFWGHMQRRDFLTLAGGVATAWPFAAPAQQSAIPVIGFLGTGSAASDAFRVAAFRQGLNEAGYVEGRNVAIETRWADGLYDRLPQLAADLVGRPVAVIFAGPIAATLAAKAATSKIPIVFANGNDPVKFGIVGSLNRPNGNITGISLLFNMLAAKHLELLHDIVPQADLIGMLENPSNPSAEVDSREIETAAKTLGRKLIIAKASTPEDIDVAFAKLADQRIGALFIHADAYFASRYQQLAALTRRYAIPAIFYIRDFVAAGGLMSYGPNIADAYRRAGVYSGRILNGEKPGELPVEQSVKVELIINLKTVKSLGLTVPMSLLGRANEVIE
jgi:putative tryptophan/tyrosine transport system substrate-binding protein